MPSTKNNRMLAYCEFLIWLRAMPDALIHGKGLILFIV